MVRNTVAFLSVLMLSAVFTGGAPAAPVTVDLSAERQMIRGFGGMNHPAWTGRDLSDSERQTAFGNAANQLGFTVLRIFVDESSNGWSRDLPTAKWASDHGVLVFASPWNPPPALRETFYRDADNPEARRLKYDSYGAYTKHLNDFVDYMIKNGVNLHAISVQNEPDYAHDWTWWTADEVVNYMKNHAGNIDSRVKVIAPEPFQYSKTILNAVLNDPTALANTDIIASHLYGTQSSAFAYPLFKEKGAGKELWMTEVYHPNSSDTANVWPQALDVGQHVHRAMVSGEFQMYVWWYIRRFYGPMLDNGTVTKRGWMMAHFSKFVRPGAIRVDASPAYQSSDNIFVSAYKNTDGSVAIVAGNKTTSAAPIEFTVNGGTLSNVEVWRTSATENMAKLQDIAANGSALSVSLPAQSMTTFISGADANTKIDGPYANTNKNTARGHLQLATVKGKTLTVNGASDTKVRIRVMNLNGRIAAKFNAAGGTSVSLRKLPTGIYIVEATRVKDGVRMTSSVMLR